jgi:hypothetical protein
MNLDSALSVLGPSQSLQSSKPAKPVPRRNQKRPKLVRPYELFAMFAGLLLPVASASSDC